MVLRNERTCQKAMFIIILGGATLFAQNEYGFREFKNETFDFIKQPLTWEAGDWLTLGLLGGVTVAVAQGDQAVRTEVLKHPGHENFIPIQAGYFWGFGYPPLYWRWASAWAAGWMIIRQ